jgi:TonB family protein
MTIAMRAVGARPKSPKVLRIGIIREGRIVAERLVSRGEAVTVGSSERSDVVVQEAAVPLRFELFRPSGDGYVLSFTDEMSGRVSRSTTQVLELEQLRRSGEARELGGHWELALNDASRGKVVISDTTVLFQFVVAPALQARPQLPAGVRAGMVRSIDWLFTAFIVATFTVMFGFIVVLENADWPVALGVATVPDEYALPIYEEPGPPPEPTDEPDDEPSDVDSEQPTDESPSEPRQPSRPTVPRPDAMAADDVERIAERAKHAAETLVVGALGAAMDGLVLDVLSGGAVPGSAQDVLSLATGVDRATSLSGTLREHSGGALGSGQQLGLDALAAQGGPRTTTAQREGREPVEAEIRGGAVLEAGGHIAGSGDFDAMLVVRKIKAQLGAIKACYERQLRSNPTLAGKVEIEFTIEERGTVSGVKVTTNSTGSTAVGSCVANAIQGFRFSPGPQGGGVTFSYPFVFAPQG